MPHFTMRPGPHGVKHERSQGTGTGCPELYGRFRRVSLFQGSRPWNLLIEYSRALTAAQNLSSLLASKSSSTTNNLKTTPSAANSARQSGCAETRRCVLKPAPPVPSAERKPPFPSSRLRAGLCFAELVSRSTERSIPRSRKSPPSAVFPNRARG